MEKKHKGIYSGLPKTYGSSMIHVNPEREARDPNFKALVTAIRVFANFR